MYVTVPPRFPASPTGMRSGLPARASIGQGLDEQSRFLAGGWKHSHNLWVADDRSVGVKEANAPSTDPLQFLIRVPPYTSYMAWGILAVGKGLCDAQVTGSSRTHRIRLDASAGARNLNNSQWHFASQVLATGSDNPTVLDVDNNTGAWAEVEVSLWLDNQSYSREIEVYAVHVEPMRLSNVGSERMAV